MYVSTKQSNDSLTFKPLPMNYFKSLLVILIFHVALLVNAEDWDEVYYPYHFAKNTDITTLNSEISKLLAEIYVDYDDKIKGFKKPTKIVAYNDRIEFKAGKELLTFKYYEDLLNCNIKVYINYTRRASDRTVLKSGYAHILVGKFHFYKDDDIKKGVQNMKDISEILLNLQYNLNIPRFDSLLKEFEPIAAKYQRLAVKPAVSEQLRELIVKANLLTESKLYERAIEEFERAVETDPTSYPDAYSNMAILSARIKRYDKAIFNMKKYLMLVPEAEDARSSQDKIYQWKLMLE